MEKNNTIRQIKRVYYYVKREKGKKGKREKGKKVKRENLVSRKKMTAIDILLLFR